MTGKLNSSNTTTTISTTPTAITNTSTSSQQPSSNQSALTSLQNQTEELNPLLETNKKPRIDHTQVRIPIRSRRRGNRQQTQLTKALPNDSNLNNTIPTITNNSSTNTQNLPKVPIDPTIGLNSLNSTTTTASNINSGTENYTKLVPNSNPKRFKNEFKEGGYVSGLRS